MLQKTALSLSCILLFLLFSCNRTLPEQMPDLGMENDKIEFNQRTQLTAPKGLNSYKAGKSISLELANLSEIEWNFDITRDIHIYTYENNEWKKVTNNIINLGDIEFTLSPKGEYPLDRFLLTILPDVKTDQSIDLRIILIAHKLTNGQEDERTGAYVDVDIRP